MRYYVTCGKCGGKIPIKGFYETVDEIREKEGEVFERTCPHCGAKRHYAYCAVSTGCIGWQERFGYWFFIPFMLFLLIPLICILTIIICSSEFLIEHNAYDIFQKALLFGAIPCILLALYLYHRTRIWAQFEKTAELAKFPRMTRELFDSLCDQELIDWCCNPLYDKHLSDGHNHVQDVCYYLYYIDIYYDIVCDGIGWEKSSDGEYLLISAYKEIGAIKHAEVLQKLMTPENERFCCSRWTEEKESDPMFDEMSYFVDKFSGFDKEENIDALLIAYLRKNADSICEA